MEGIIKIWWNLTSAPSFITSASFPSQSQGRIGIWGHVTGFARRWQREAEISLVGYWRFYSANCDHFSKLQSVHGYTRVQYSFWLYRRFASVEVDVELWSIRSVECCFERANSPSSSREVCTFLSKTRLIVPDVFAEWFCVDAHYIIRTTSYKSFICQFIIIGIYELKVRCLYS